MPTPETSLDQETEEERESRLLSNPVDNASALYDLYQDRLGRIKSRYDETGLFDVKDFVGTCERQKIVAKLLPEDDPRSYEAWNRELNQRRQELGSV